MKGLSDTQKFILVWKISFQKHCPIISAQDRNIEKVLKMQSFNLLLLLKIIEF